MHRLLPVILTAAIAPLAAQWVLSVMAGYVHHAEGEVFLDDEAIHPEPDDLLHIPEGGRLRTARGRAEIMVTPASYLRIGPESSVRLVESGLLSAVAELEDGAAVLDLSPGVEPDAVRILLDGTPVALTKGGLYRFETSPEPVVRVIEGRAEVSGEKVKPGRTFHLAEARLEKTPDAEPDELDQWSRSRSEQLAAALQKRREEGEGMSELERMWLDMTLRRPTPPPQTQSRSPAPRSSGGRR